MNDKFIVIDGFSQAANGSMVQRRIDRWNTALLSVVGGDGVAILAKDPKVDDYIEVEGCGIAGAARTEELIYSRVCGNNLIVVGCCWGQAREDNSIGVCPRGCIS